MNRFAWETTIQRRWSLDCLLAGLGALGTTAGCSAPPGTGARGSVCSASVGGDAPGVVFTLSPAVTTYGRSDSPVVELTIPIRRSVLQAQSTSDATDDHRSEHADQ